MREHSKEKKPLRRAFGAVKRRRAALAMAVAIGSTGVLPIGGALTSNAVAAAEPIPPEDCYRELSLDEDGSSDWVGAHVDSWGLSSDGGYLVAGFSERNADGSEWSPLALWRIDTSDGSRTRVDVAVDGGLPNGVASQPHISDDGRYVAFISPASNLVDGDDNALPDVFVRDLEEETTERISVGNDESGVDSSSLTDISVAALRTLDMSEDGQVVAFATDVALDETDLDDSSDVYVRELSGERATLLVSPYVRSFYPVLSADGRYTAFMTYQGQAVGSAAEAIHVDRETETVQEVVADQGWIMKADPIGLSGDGSTVAFNTNLDSLEFHDVLQNTSRQVDTSSRRLNGSTITLSHDGALAGYPSRLGYVATRPDGSLRLIIDEGGQPTHSDGPILTSRGQLLADGHHAFILRRDAYGIPTYLSFVAHADRAGASRLTRFGVPFPVEEVPQGESSDLAHLAGSNLYPGVSLNLSEDVRLASPALYGDAANVRIEADLDAAPGPRTLTVTAPSGCSTSFVTFDVVDSKPSITWASATRLHPSSTKTITYTGTNLSCPCTVEVSGGVTAGTPTSTGDTTLQVALTTPAFVQDAMSDLTITNKYGNSLLIEGAIALHTAEGEFHAVNPERILDTRYGVGGPQQPIGQTPRSVQVAGFGHVPTGGQASAVVMNVTTVSPTSGSYVTVWPAGEQQPLASNLNMLKGQTVANFVTVPLGTNGAVNAFVANGSADLIFDVVGYYSSESGTAGGRFVPLEPERLVDTRELGEPLARIEEGTVVFPDSPIRAVVLNVTVTNPAAGGYISVVPSDSMPNVSSVNFTQGQTVANLVTVGLGPDRGISVYNASDGATHVIIDIVGVYGDATTDLGDSAFRPLVPTRFLDTRTGVGASSVAKVGSASTIPLDVAGRLGVPEDAAAITGNLTAVAPSRGSYLTAWPDGLDQPATSNLNFLGGQIVPNKIVMGLGETGGINIFNAAGEVDVITDISGWFTPVVMESADAVAAGFAAAARALGAAPGQGQCFRCEPPEPEITASGWHVSK